jgi:hypothetical protein
MNVRIAIFVLLFCPSLAAAQTTDAPPVRIDIPLLDVPYNTAHGYRAPSMAQSLAISEGFYEGSHRWIQRAWGDHVWLSRFSIIAADALDTLILPLPGSDGWVHEEYHRSILGRRGFDSFNDVYRFRVNADAIAVSHVDDADLVALKRDHPAEQVRLNAAGIEGEYDLVQRLEGGQFFHRSPAWHAPLYWLVKIGSASYVSSGASDETNAETDDMNRRDGSNVAIRDFTGHDFTAWAYDLFRPGEPYAARGAHPSGVGIDRYIKPDDLTAEERAYLEHQGRLQLLNFVDPFLFGVQGITIAVHGQPLRFNANLGHLLTPFGRTIDSNVFVTRGHTNLLLIAHAYANQAHTFPGLEARLIDWPLHVAGHAVSVTPRAAVWRQPAGQAFRAASGAGGGLVGVKVRHDGRRLGAFAELEAKSAGWVAGTAALDRDVSVRVGLSIAVR